MIDELKSLPNSPHDDAQDGGSSRYNCRINIAQK